MFILSPWIHFKGISYGPQFAKDFPTFGFALNPESQRPKVGDNCRLEIFPPIMEEKWNWELSPEQRLLILEKYIEVN